MTQSKGNVYHLKLRNTWKRIQKTKQKNNIKTIIDINGSFEITLQIKQPGRDPPQGIING